MSFYTMEKRKAGKQNPYRLLPAMVMMTSGSLKTFLSRTHTSGEMFARLFLATARGEFIIENSALNSLCMFSTCESYVLCILMPCTK